MAVSVNCRLSSHVASRLLAVRCATNNGCGYLHQKSTFHEAFVLPEQSIKAFHLTVNGKRWVECMKDRTPAGLVPDMAGPKVYSAQQGVNVG